MTIYDRDYWWSDKWDQLQTGRDYDFSRPFFEQFRDLLQQAPLPNLANSNCPGVEYGNHNTNCKNCYLVHASYGAEDCSYVTGAVDAKDSFDLYKLFKGTQCYEDILCSDDNRVFFSQDSDESIQSDFLYSCKNVQQSLGCVNVHNRSYYIFNQPHSKEEYLKERSKYDFGSYKTLEEFKKKFEEFHVKYPRRYAMILKSQNVTGDAIGHSKNCRSCFDVYGQLEDCKYQYHVFGMKDCYDGYGAGDNSELMYEVVDTGVNGMYCRFTVFTHSSHDVDYAYCCHSSANLFGCVGLRSKQYCILNKQYTKEEYEALVPKILKHMQDMPYVDSKGRKYEYGEFFPVELSPFAYNEAVAQEYLPLTFEAAKEQGYPWRIQEEKHYKITISAEDLADHIKDVPDSILQEVIECAHKSACNQQCTSAFKIIPAELQFYRAFNLAVPRLCPNCRHYERLAKRNLFKLWNRSCQCAGEKSSNGEYFNTSTHIHGSKPCDTEFETPYAPEKPEIVYCEKCYQSEIL